MSYDENRISDQIDGGLHQQKEDRQRLLDHFAGLAMSSFLQSEFHMKKCIGDIKEDDRSLALSSYRIAEAMLAERERRMKG